VLVVEDNENVGQFAAEALRELGFDSVLVGDARQALQELDKDKGRFDIVFSDVVIPGLSGLDLAEEIRRRYPGLPVILASGYSHILATGGAHGFELLPKPYSIEQLSIAIDKVVVRRRTA
jgi:DNA-binding NtrC family response regulator